MMLTTRQFSSFADDVDALAAQADPKAVSILGELSDRTREVAKTMQTAEGADRLEGATDWLNTYKRVMSACEAVGSPIGLAR